MAKDFTVLLYYKYVPLENVEELHRSQRELCERLNLKGRILLSEEGINGTLAGTADAVKVYQEETAKHPALADLEWKLSYADEQVFPKLKVTIREEIVTLGVKKTGTDVSLENKAHYIEPDELRALYDNNEEFIIIDARNDYEAKIGKFKNAIVPPIRNFREFPEFVKGIEGYKDKNVITYCTGGVRCEKASAYLRENGFKQVRQLHGGIHEYGEKAGGKNFEGEMFVFDKRIHLPVNTVNPEPITECVFCHERIARYIDCAVPSCNELFICCQGCQASHQTLCTDHWNAAQSELPTAPPTAQATT